MALLDLIKKLPIDLGQREMRHRTFEKIASLRMARKLLVKKDGEKKVLDLGCGDGFWTEKLKLEGWDVTAVDRESDYPAAEIIDINAGLPFPDNHFDLVWSAAVIAYLDDPQFAASEIRRVTKQGGYYILTTPNVNFWFNGFLKLFGSSLTKLQDQKQKHFFTEDEIKKLFPNEKLYGFFPYIFLKWRISRFVGLLSPTFIIVGHKS